MYRKKFTLELLVKTVASFSFGFLVGYVVFSLIARPNFNRAFAELATPTDITNDTTNDTPAYPRTFSDLPELPTETVTPLAHTQKPSFVPLYNYARYYFYYSKSLTSAPTETSTSEPAVTAPEPEPEPESEPIQE